MRGVRCLRLTYLHAYFQVMLVDDIRKAIATDRIVPVERLPIHIPELHPAYPGISGADGPNELQHERLLRHPLHHL